MPRGDRRGPEMAGPMTGRGLGFCAGSHRPGFTADAPPHGGAGRGRDQGQGQGRGQGEGRGGRGGGRGGMGSGQGFGYGGGRGRGWGYNPDSDLVSDAASTDESVDRGPDLVQELASLMKRIKVLEERLADSGKDDN